MHKLKKNISFNFPNILYVFILFFAVSTFAQTNSRSDDLEQTKSENYNDSIKNRDIEQQFIYTNIMIAQWFDSVTEGIDLFLVGERLTHNKNPSSIRLENTTETKESENLTNSSNLSVNVRLQNLEQYFQFKLMSEDQEGSQKSSAKKNYSNQKKNQKYSAAVGLFKNLGKIRTTFQPRLELTDPLAISHSLKFESLADYANWQINPKLELFALATKGIGTVKAINFHYTINKKFALTQINEFEYYEKSHEFSGIQGLVLSQYINPKSSLSYQIFLDSFNRPSYHLKSYDIGVTYSRTIYKKILDFQLTPHVTFPKTNEFKGILGAVFTLAVNF